MNNREWSIKCDKQWIVCYLKNKEFIEADVLVKQLGKKEIVTKLLLKLTCICKYFCQIFHLQKIHSSLVCLFFVLFLFLLILGSIFNEQLCKSTGKRHTP